MEKQEHQSVQKKKKLSFDKFNIAKIQNSQTIIGGNDPIRTDNTQK